MRPIRKTPVCIPYDEVLEEIQILSCFQEDLVRRAAAGDFGEEYDRHPLRRHDDAVVDVPIGLFVDGVPTVKKDSCIGFFLFNVLTETRFLVTILWKRCLCNCGYPGRVFLLRCVVF